jgi:hypothetical protein
MVFESKALKGTCCDFRQEISFAHFGEEIIIFLNHWYSHIRIGSLTGIGRFILFRNFLANMDVVNWKLSCQQKVRPEGSSRHTLDSDVQRRKCGRRNILRTWRHSLLYLNILLSVSVRSKNCEKRLLISSCQSVCLSDCPHGTTRLPLEGFLWNFIFGYFSKICPENSALIKIRQE